MHRATDTIINIKFSTDTSSNDTNLSLQSLV